MTKSVLWTTAKYVLAFGVLGYVIFANWEPSGDQGGLKKIWDDHVVNGQPIDGIYLLLAFSLHLVGLMTTLIRWYILVRAQGLPFTLLAAFRLGTLGFLFNAFLPGAVGGDLIKAAALAREQRRQTVAVATVVMDRALSVWGLILLLAIVGAACWIAGVLEGPALGPSRPVIVSAIVIIIISGMLWFVMGLCSPAAVEHWKSKLGRVPKVGDTLSQLWEAVWLYRHRPGTMVWAIALSTLSNVCDILAFYCYVLTFWDGLPGNPLPSLTEHFLLVPVGLVISGVPLFPGGAGIGEAGFGGLYRLFDSAPANGVLGSLLFRVSGWMIGILGYLLCSIIGRK